MFLDILVLLIALLHIYFFVLEAFLWTKPLGKKTFKLTDQYAKDSKALAANQGVYNLFLSLSLLVGVFSENIFISQSFTAYGLGCVLIAGIVGGVTVNKRIFLIQGLPALIALIIFAVL